jgi:hypothetical protein
LPPKEIFVMDRVLGVLTFRSPVYRQIAEDPNATTTAAIIVAIVSVLSGVAGAAVYSAYGSQLQTMGLSGVSNPIVFALVLILYGVVGWFVASWVVGLVANVLGGKTTTGEILRVFGYSSIFNLLGILPCIGWILAPLLSLVAGIMGVREAAKVSTGKAIVIGIVGGIAIAIVIAVLGGILYLILPAIGLI